MKFIPFFLIIVFLAGCASRPTPAKFYDGAERPLNQVARVRMANVKIWVVGVDGMSTRDWQLGLLSTSELRIIPGSHEFTLLHTRNESLLEHERAETKLVTSVQVGHFYTMRYRNTDGNHVEFYIVDHGASYDEKCSRLLNEMSIHIYMGTDVPLECY